MKKKYNVELHFNDCREEQLNGAVHRMTCQSRSDTIKIPLCSKAKGTKERTSIFATLSRQRWRHIWYQRILSGTKNIRILVKVQRKYTIYIDKLIVYCFTSIQWYLSRSRRCIDRFLYPDIGARLRKDCLKN